MSEELEIPGAESSSRSAGPGERLQAARIEQGLALDELAHQMHLSVGILESLENNRFDDIAAPIFVKGYLRSYARIVDLDEGEILDLYVNEYMQGDPPIGSTSNGLADGGAARKRPGHGRRWLLLFLVVLLVAGGWWYQRSQQSEQTLSLDAASENANPSERAEAPAVMPTPEVQQLSSEAGQRLEQLEPVQPESLEALPSPLNDERASTTPPAATPAPSAIQDEPAVEVSGQQPAEEMASNPVEVGVETDAEAGAPVASDETSEIAAAPPQPVVPAAAPLQMTITADTWVDIRDARGKKLVYNLLRAGRKINIDGQPPLKLFFGNGHGVELRWKGQPVDLASRIRADNTVRITLE